MKGHRSSRSLCCSGHLERSPPSTCPGCTKARCLSSWSDQSWRAWCSPAWRCRRSRAEVRTKTAPGSRCRARARRFEQRLCAEGEGEGEGEVRASRPRRVTKRLSSTHREATRRGVWQTREAEQGASDPLLFLRRGEELRTLGASTAPPPPPRAQKGGSRGGAPPGGT